MVLGSKTGESLYIPRVTEEREILSKIDSADGNLISQLKDDIVKIFLKSLRFTKYLQITKVSF